MHAHYYRIWDQHREFAVTSRKLRKAWRMWQCIFMWMTLVGTVCAAMGAQTMHPFPAVCGKAFGCAGAVLLALGAFLSKEFYSSTKELLWTKAYSLAELIKSEAFLYATQIAPYQGPQAGAELRRKIDALIGTSASLFSGDLEESDRKPAPDLPMGLPEYVRKRIADRKEHYKTVLKHARSAHWRWRSVQLTLGAAIVALGVIAGFVSSADMVNACIVLISAVAGILASYTALGRYDYLRKSCGALYIRMSDLEAESEACADAKVFIAKCEAELAAEHRSWLAEWQKPPAPKRSETTRVAS
jgi:hypothetical protein